MTANDTHIVCSDFQVEWHDVLRGVTPKLVGFLLNAMISVPNFTSKLWQNGGIGPHMRHRLVSVGTCLLWDLCLAYHFSSFMPQHHFGYSDMGHLEVGTVHQCNRHSVSYSSNGHLFFASDFAIGELQVLVDLFWVFAIYSLSRLY